MTRFESIWRTVLATFVVVAFAVPAFLAVCVFWVWANLPSFPRCEDLARALIFVFVTLAVTCRAASDRDVVAAVIVAEAGGESLDAMRGVAAVIQNRAESRHEPKVKIVTQRKWFSCLNYRTPDALVELELSHARYVAALTMADGVTDNVGGATNFYAPKGMKGGKPPYWASTMTVTARIGGLIFLK